MPRWRTTCTLRDHLGDTVVVVQGEGATRSDAEADARKALLGHHDNQNIAERVRVPLEGDTFTTATTLVQAR